MALVFGLDIGIASIGWAAIDEEQEMLKGLSLSTLKCSTIAFGDMQKLVIKYLLTAPVNITLAIKLQHNSDDLPSTKSDPAHIAPLTTLAPILI